MINFYKKMAFKLLKQLDHGSIRIKEGKSEYCFSGKHHPREEVIVTVYDPGVYKQFILMGTNGISSSYFDKRWDCNNLLQLFDVILKNKPLFKKMDSGITKLFLLRDTFVGLFSKVNFHKAKVNILKHYDLSNAFFKQFLDEKMMYSCAVYDHDDLSLDQAAEYKLKKICDKLALTPNDHLLEIGTGWGGLALYAHKHYGCKVTTTTISDQQYHYVKNLIEKENVANHVTLLNQDFRCLEGKYDKIVSVEMIEAVGFKLFPDFFKKINGLLKDNGLFLLQCITINDDDYERAKFEVDFIKKYIFPGGCLPSVATIKKIVNNQTQLQLQDFEDIGLHYVRTLVEWRRNFHHNLANIFSLGFSQSFARMWEYYFSYCQAGFQNKHISDIQVLWKKTS